MAAITGMALGQPIDIRHMTAFGGNPDIEPTWLHGRV